MRDSASMTLMFLFLVFPNKPLAAEDIMSNNVSTFILIPTTNRESCTPFLLLLLL